jgi:uncharacterized protein YegJ (DUF2314 family)
MANGNKKIFEKQEEPLFMNLDSKNEEYKKTVYLAQKQMPRFIEMLKITPEKSKSCVKVYIPLDSIEGAYIWLNYPEFKGDSCTACIFEIPPEYKGLYPGDQLEFSKDDIQDWFIIDENGGMEGGFSLRYQRSKLSIKRQMEFDKYIGVKKYL